VVLKDCLGICFRPGPFTLKDLDWITNDVENMYQPAIAFFTDLIAVRPTDMAVADKLVTDMSRLEEQREKIPVMTLEVTCEDIPDPAFSKLAQTSARQKKRHELEDPSIKEMTKAAKKLDALKIKLQQPVPNSLTVEAPGTVSIVRRISRRFAGGGGTTGSKLTPSRSVAYSTSVHRQGLSLSLVATCTMDQEHVWHTHNSLTTVMSGATLPVLVVGDRSHIRQS